MQTQLKLAIIWMYITHPHTGMQSQLMKSHSSFRMAMHAALAYILASPISD